jgi:predicted nucleic acid-binding protein
MNGRTNTQTSRSVVFDTNVIIKYVNKKPGFIDLDTRFAGDDWHISIVTKLELLAFPGIDAAEKERTLRFLQIVSIVPLMEKAEADIIKIRRKYRPKLPDAIIAATAMVLGATLVTSDGPLAKKKIPGLPIILEPSPSTKASWRSVVVKYRPFWIAISCLTISTLVFAILFILT